MRRTISISNIAWPADADDEALKIAHELGFRGIELAPSKVFGPLENANLVEVARYRATLEDRGFVIPALQAILFGVTDAHLFMGEILRSNLAERLTRVAEIAGLLGAKACVFGSPALRDPGDMEPGRALEIAEAFFRSIAPRFASQDSTLAFEANPPIYNCRFVTTTLEAIELVDRVDAPGFDLQLDGGTIFANNETAETVITAARRAAHCHASEPHLVPLGSGENDHTYVGAALRQARYAGWISVEMKATEDWRAAMRSSAQIVSTAYKKEGT